jgi:hypothetical protein
MKYEMSGFIFEADEVEDKTLKCYKPIFTLEEAISMYNEGMLQGRRLEEFDMNALDFFKAKFNLDISSKYEKPSKG